MHEYEGTFQGRPAHFRMTSVIGHVLRYSDALHKRRQGSATSRRAACARSQHVLAVGQAPCVAALLSIDCLVTAGINISDSC